MFFHISKKTLSRYHDKEILDKKELNKIEKHLSECDKCKNYLNKLKYISHTINRDFIIPSNINDKSNIVLFKENKKNKRLNQKYLLPLTAGLILLFTMSWILVNNIIDYNNDAPNNEAYLAYNDVYSEVIISHLLDEDISLEESLLYTVPSDDDMK